MKLSKGIQCLWKIVLEQENEPIWGFIRSADSHVRRSIESVADKSVSHIHSRSLFSGGFELASLASIAEVRC